MKAMYTLLGVAILAVVAAHGRVGASDDNTVWSATMTVGEAFFGQSDDDVFQGYYRIQVAGAPSPFGHLSDDDFEYGGTTYTIQAIIDNTPDTILSLSVHPVLAETAPLALEADGHGSLQFDRATWYDTLAVKLAMSVRTLGTSTVRTGIGSKAMLLTFG